MSFITFYLHATMVVRRKTFYWLP